MNDERLTEVVSACRVDLPQEPFRGATLVACDSKGEEAARWFAGTGKWTATGGYWWDHWADVVWVCLLRRMSLRIQPGVAAVLVQEWRPVPGHEGYFEVSSVGNVRSVDRHIVDNGGRRRLIPGRDLTLHRRTKRTAHLAVKLLDKTVPVEHLVAAAWIGPRKPGQIVRHWDDDPTNNTVSNILYGTYSDNAHDRVRNAKRTAPARCSRRHLLEPPNLKDASNGKQECRSCVNARTYCRRNGIEKEIQEISDRYYLEIALGVPEMRQDVRRLLGSALEEVA